MSTNAKIGIAVGALVALVFGVTIISQLPTTPSGPDNPNQPAEAAKAGLQPVVNAMQYQPSSGRAELREYQQYYETGSLTVPFWVCNRNEVPITVKFGYTSCVQCSLAEVAIVPPLPFDPEGDPDPFGAVVGGIAGKASFSKEDPPPFGLNDVGYRARKRAEADVPAADWKPMKPGRISREVGDTGTEVVIPAATGPDKPVWAIFRLNVKLTTTKVLETRFDCTRPDAPQPLPLPLKIDLRLADPCMVYPTDVDFKSMPAEVKTAEETVYFWSSTRGFGTSADGLLTPLPPPDVDAARTPHLSFSPPVPATPEETAALARRLSPDPNAPQVRVTAAYKTTLQFSRTVTDNGKTTDADLGPFERSVGLTAKGSGVVLNNTPTVKVRAHLLGVVRLAEGTANVKDDKIDLGSFNARDGLSRTVSLVSDTPGIELEVVPEKIQPNFLKVDPALKVDRKGDRTIWTLTVRIDKDVGGGELRAGSVVVLRIKGTGQLIRIPVTGRGTA